MKWKMTYLDYWVLDAKMVGAICVSKDKSGMWIFDYRLTGLPGFFYDPPKFDTKEEAINAAEVWHDGMLKAEKILAGIADKDG